MTTADYYLYDGISKFIANQDSQHIVRQNSRNGPVIRWSSPTITTYEPNLVPVVRSPLRDANPFFHLYESFYFLTGRNDLASLAYYNSGYANFSDDQKTIWGCYGNRWLEWFGDDQIAQLLIELESNPESRRGVLQMWDGAQDLQKAVAGGKDTPCNFSIVFGALPSGELEMSVLNRSNDLLWGQLGANLVHFNILHSYVASLLGVKKGRYHQISTNLHMYLDYPITGRFLKEVDSKLEFTTEAALEQEGLVKAQRSGNFESHAKMFEGLTGASAKDKHLDYKSMLQSVLSVENGKPVFETRNQFAGRCYPFLDDVLHPMMNAYELYKTSSPGDARDFLIEVNDNCDSVHKDSEWIWAGIEWMERRAISRKQKENK